MKEKKVKVLKTLAETVIFVAAAVWLFNLFFAKSYTDIMKQMLRTSKEGIVSLTLMETGFILMDSMTISLFIKRYRWNYSWGEGLEVLLYGNFYKGITFGGGTKVAQIYLLKKQNVPPGVSSGILTMQYVFHRIGIIINSTLMMIAFKPFRFFDFKTYKLFFIFGYGANLFIILILILMCTWRKFHDWMLFLIENILKYFHKEEYMREVRKYFIELERESHFLMQKVSWCIGVIIVNCMKLFFCYAIPYAAYISIIGRQPSITLLEVMALTAVMNLLIGVIPAPVGMGSTEVVYLILFTALFGKVTAGTTMIIYRLFTYYMPFLLSALFMAGYHHREKKKEKMREAEKIKEGYSG